MPEDSKVPKKTGTKIIARCICENCKKRVLQEVQISGAVKKGAKTSTKCKECAIGKTDANLIFQSEFK